jgi:DNA-binding MarR family transcriptional regulator
MGPRPISARGLAALIEQVSRIVHGTGHAEGLYPAQWAALRYFAAADAPARTATGLSRFQGMSIGPVARTVRTLVEKGYLARRPNPRSRRADLLEVTPTGRALLERDPRQQVVIAVDALTAAEREGLAEGLEAVLRQLLGQRPT